ncbi:MgtC/SapB family protein [Halomonas sp. HK25]|uniref:MgtC/SapB family protein n=1 Tax=Halomonas sp. HK25 TaxID=3394321 RepID=UPI0039FD8C26
MDDVAGQFIASNQTAIQLAVALLLGALIGIERGWVAREQKSGERIAGIRTHALVGLLGGIAALLSEALVAWAFPLLFLAVAAIGLVAWRARVAVHRDYSITGLIGLLLTFCFGAVAVAIDLALATACAVITAVIHPALLGRGAGAGLAGLSRVARSVSPDYPRRCSPMSPRKGAPVSRQAHGGRGSPRLRALTYQARSP